MIERTVNKGFGIFCEENVAKNSLIEKLYFLFQLIGFGIKNLINKIR